jgi:hypothetical protein
VEKDDEFDQIGVGLLPRKAPCQAHRDWIVNEMTLRGIAFRQVTLRRLTCNPFIGCAPQEKRFSRDPSSRGPVRSHYRSSIGSGTSQSTNSAEH